MQRHQPPTFTKAEAEADVEFAKPQQANNGRLAVISGATTAGTDVATLWKWDKVEESFGAAFAASADMSKGFLQKPQVGLHRAVAQNHRRLLKAGGSRWG